MSKKSRPLVLPLGIAAAIVLFSYFFLSSGSVAYLTPTQLAENASNYPGEVRVFGKVKSGSLNWSVQEQLLTFTITDGKTEMEVEYRGPLPADIGETKSVVAAGPYDGKIRARQILVKCPTKEKHGIELPESFKTRGRTEAG